MIFLCIPKLLKKLNNHNVSIKDMVSACIYCGKKTKCEACPPLDKTIVKYVVFTGGMSMITPPCVKGPCCNTVKSPKCKFCPHEPTDRCACCCGWVCRVHNRPFRKKRGHDELDYLVICAGCEKYKTNVETRSHVKNPRWLLQSTIAKYQKAQIKVFRYKISSALNRYEMATPMLINYLVDKQIKLRHFNPANFKL